MTEETAPPQGFWAEEFDLSALSYPQFLAFFFERPVVSDGERYDRFRSGIDYFIASTPAIVVDHLHRMCCELADQTKVYSPEQIDQGLGAFSVLASVASNISLIHRLTRIRGSSASRLCIFRSGT